MNILSKIIKPKQTSDTKLLELLNIQNGQYKFLYEMQFKENQVTIIS